MLDKSAARSWSKERIMMEIQRRERDLEYSERQMRAYSHRGADDRPLNATSGWQMMLAEEINLLMSLL